VHLLRVEPLVRALGLSISDPWRNFVLKQNAWLRRPSPGGDAKSETQSDRETKTALKIGQIYDGRQVAGKATAGRQQARGKAEGARMNWESGRVKGENKRKGKGARDVNSHTE